MVLEVGVLLSGFILGFLSKMHDLPPLVGYLAAGFLLNAQNWYEIDVDGLEVFSKLGVTLLLFTVGLKLKVKGLVRPEIWGTAVLHMGLFTVVTACLIFALAHIAGGVSGSMGDVAASFPACVLVAFAFSFSSTIFVIKILDDIGESNGQRALICIGILIIQDVAAVVFLGVSYGEKPTSKAWLLLFLLPLRWVIKICMDKIDHSELLVLLGLTLGLGGATLFELVQLKGDLGALIMGVMIGTHPRSNEMAHVLYPFKDLFLLGFFMSVGLDYGPPTGMAAGLCAFFLALSWLKFYQFYGLSLGFAMRNYSAYSCALSLSNYSEFALIVMDIGVDKGWLDPYWMVVTALTVSMSWAIGSPIISRENVFYNYRCCRLQCERKKRIPGEELVDIGSANIMIVGMGRVGTAVYHELCNDEEGEINDRIVGIEASPDIVVKHRSKGLNVLLGDAHDFDFWARCGGTQDQIKLLLLTMDSHSANLMVCSNFHERKFSGFIAATARYNDEVEALKKNGAHIAFDVFAEAGSGFAGHVLEEALSHFDDIIHDSTQEEEPSQETKEFHNWLYHAVKHDLEFGRQSNNHSPEGTELHKKAADRLFSITSRTRKTKKSSKGRSGERSKRHDLKSIPAPSAREDSLGHGNDEEDESEHTVNFIPAPTNESNNPGRECRPGGTSSLSPVFAGVMTPAFSGAMTPAFSGSAISPLPPLSGSAISTPPAAHRSLMDSPAKEASPPTRQT
eukprot:g7885.t1